MPNFHKTLLLTVLFAFTALAASADAPRWVRKGVRGLNGQRSNDTYEFVSLNTHDIDLGYLKAHRTDALKSYIDEVYDPEYGTIELTVLSPGNKPQYKIDYMGKDGQSYTVQAMLVDEYEEFDDFEINVYQYEYYQLYAMSKPNVVPVYDKFNLTTNYNGQAVIKSIIPGMGQLDKGQTTKGWVILGGEIGFIGAGLYFDYMRRDAKKERDKGNWNADSWNSKRQAWQNFEIGAFGCAAALYIYNLIDAATSKGARQVEVKKVKSPSYTISPIAMPNEVGVQFVLNF